MKPIEMEHFGGKGVWDERLRLRQALEEAAQGVNEIILSQQGAGPYPYLSLLIQGDYAYLWFAPDDDSAGCCACGKDMELDPEGVTVFCVNGPGDEVEIGNGYVDRKERAIAAALEIAARDTWPAGYEDLPRCLEWERL